MNGEARERQQNTSTTLRRSVSDERELRKMRLHSTFSPASLFSLSEASMQNQLLVRVDKNLQPLRSVATAAAAVAAQAAAAPPKQGWRGLRISSKVDRKSDT